MIKFVAQKIGNYVLPDAIPKVQRSLVKNSNTKDIIILLGWGGAKQKNFKRILNFYQTRDVTVVSCVMPQFVPTFVKNFYESEIARVVQKIKDDDMTLPSKLYGHTFSNNGAWTLATLCQRPDLPPFDKLLIDSAPAFSFKRISISEEVRIIARVMTSVVLRRPEYEHPVISPLVKSVLFIAIPIWRLTNVVQKVIDEDILPDYLMLNIFMRDKSPNVPTYFIYSDGDALVPSYLIREFKKHLEDRNVLTFERVYCEDVPHVSAFFKYPEEYKEILDSFFDLRKGEVDLQGYYRD